MGYIVNSRVACICSLCILYLTYFCGLLTGLAKIMSGVLGSDAARWSWDPATLQQDSRNALAVIPAEAWELVPKDGSLTGHICRDLFLPGWHACFVHVSVVFYKYNFIYFMHLLWAALGLPCWAGLSLVAANRGHSPVAVGGLLLAVASLVEEHRLH